MAPTNLLVLLIAVVALITPSLADYPKRPGYGHLPPAQSPKPGPRHMPPYFGRPPRGHVLPPLPPHELPLIPYAPGPVVLPPEGQFPGHPPEVYHGQISAQPPKEGHHGHFPAHPPKEWYHGPFPGHPPRAGPHGHFPFPF